MSTRSVSLLNSTGHLVERLMCACTKSSSDTSKDRVVKPRHQYSNSETTPNESSWQKKSVYDILKIFDMGPQGYCVWCKCAKLTIKFD